MRRVLLPLLLAACHHAAEPDPIDESLQPGVVKLVDAGHGEPQVLRFHPTPGSQQSVTTTTNAQVDLHGQTSNRGPQGGATVAETIAVSAAADDARALAITIDRAELGGHTMPGQGGVAHQTLDPDGRLRDLDGDPAAVKLQRSFQALIAAPLPTEPIAPGARWRYLTPIDSGLLQLSYQLVSVDGDRVTLHVRLRFRAAAGASAEAIHLDGSGEGDLTLDLSKPLPVAATVQSSMDMRGSLEGSAIDMSMRETMTLQGG